MLYICIWNKEVRFLGNCNSNFQISKYGFRPKTPFIIYKVICMSYILPTSLHTCRHIKHFIFECFLWVLYLCVEWFTYIKGYFVSAPMVFQLYPRIFCCMHIFFVHDARTNKGWEKNMHQSLNCSEVISCRSEETEHALLPLHRVRCQTLFSSKHLHACMIGSEEDLMLNVCQHWPSSTGRRAAAVKLDNVTSCWYFQNKAPNKVCSFQTFL